MISPDMVGWVATLFMVVGSLLIAHKNVGGLWAMFVGNLIFAYAGFMVDLWSLVWVSLFLAVLDCYGVYKWRTVCTS